MALLWMDGFETLPGVRPAYTIYSTPTSVVGRLPTLKGITSASSTMALLPLPGNYPTLTVGFAFKITNSMGTAGYASTFAGYRVLSFMDGTTDQLSFNQSASGFWQVRRGAANGTILQTATTGIPVTGAWHHFEVKVTIHDTAGSVEARMDEQPILNITGVDTKNTANAWASHLSLPITAYYEMDDLYVMDNTGTSMNGFIGDNIITAWRPSGTGETSQFVGSDGNSTNNFELVDDNPPNAATYVESNTAGQRDLYTVSGASLAGAAIRAVSPIAYAAKTGPGVRSGKHVVRSETGTVSTYTFEGTLTNVTRPVAPSTPPLTLDPDGQAWTETKLAATQFGVETV